VRELEAEAMADKEWHLRGEVAALHRPLNSALEVDVDFDTTGTRKVECLICRTTHARTHAHMHARAHTHTHIHTRIHPSYSLRAQQSSKQTCEWQAACARGL